MRRRLERRLMLTYLVLVCLLAWAPWNGWLVVGAGCYWHLILRKRGFADTDTHAPDNSPIAGDQLHPALAALIADHNQAGRVRRAKN